MAVEPVASAEPGPARGPHRGSGHAHGHGQSQHQSQHQSTGPASQRGMRRQNLALVMGSVAAHGPLSRAEVAERTGLTRAAVGSLAAELAAARLITDHGIAPSGRVGRPGAMLAVSGTGPAGLGLEVGVGHLAACLVDLRGETRAYLRCQTDNRGRDPGTVLGELARVAGRVAHEGAAEGLRAVGAVLAVPGLVADQSRRVDNISGAAGPGLVERAPNLHWHKAPAAALLQDRFPAPLRGIPLRVDNEANLGALAELWDGTSVGAGDFVHVSAEAGIGAAIVVGGRLLRGVHGFAGELGHVPVQPDGPRCACGARGCLEQYAGEEAVLRAAGWPSGPGDPVEVLAERAEITDARVCAALEQAGGALGTALAGAVNLLDPTAVILGGAYADLGTWLLPAMRRELAARVTVRPWSADALVVSRLGRRGPLLGAAMSTVRQIIEDPWLFARSVG
ncbi:MAG TPA: ROK family protein [Actinocrinis sp.]